MESAAAAQLFAHMRDRSHVAPKRLEGPGPSAQELDRLFEAAAQAPDHGRIRPWRFIVVPVDKRAELGQAFAQALLARDAHASPEALERAHAKAFRAPCLMLAVVSHTPSEPLVPLQERLISLGCAIQNMLLMAQALSLGSGITSGQAMHAASVRELFKLRDDEEAVCYLAFGRVVSHKPPRRRMAIAEFVSSL
jgi:nitroreductase